MTDLRSLALPATLPVAEAVAAGQGARKVLFSAMKNEAPFVLEWIAYHKVIGFDEIVICSNPSNDGMEELLAALAEAGEITHLKVTVPPGRSPQIVASRAFTDRVGYRDGDWYLWLDADEFLNVHVGDRTISGLVSALADRQFALINWRIFGSSGHARFGGRFISGDFSGAAVPEFAPQLEQKTLFQFSKAVASFGQLGINRPLLAKGPTISAKRVVVGSGKPVAPFRPKHRNWLAGADSSGTAKVQSDEFGWALAQINHYVVRTPEFFALKRLRGRGYKANAAGTANDRHTDAFFVAHDRNEAEDRTILHWEGRVTEEIARLLRVPPVADAKQRSDALVLAILAQGESPEAPTTAGPLQPALPEPAADVPAAAPPAPSFALTFPRREAGLVRRMYAAATNILEYGSGGSTVLAARLGKRVIGVESDRAWAERLQAELAAFPAARVHHVFIGPTEKWGIPSRPRHHGRFHRYALAVWDLPDLGDPDLVLINGRFRPACLAAVMLRAKRPTTVLFDDYENRPEYHGVERLARKEEVVGRMARFTVTPGAIPSEMLTEVIGWFSDPR